MKNLSILALSLLISLNAFSHESVGGRGGGTGVLCEGSPLVTVEEYEMGQKGVENQIPDSRNAVLRLVRKKLKEYPEVLKSWEENWEKLGPYKNWRIKNATAYKKLMIEAAKSIMPVDTDSAEFLLEQDDLIKLPSHCTKVQISYFFDDVLYKYNNVPDLSESSQRYLELHESFYMLGVSDYNHFFPHKTRNVIMALSQPVAPLYMALVKFMEKNVETDFVQSLSGVYRLENTKVTSGRCPWVVIYLAESNEMISEIAIFIKNNIHEVSRVERNIYSQDDFTSEYPILKGEGRKDRAFFHAGDMMFWNSKSYTSCDLKSMKGEDGKPLSFKNQIHYAKIAQQMFLPLGTP